MLFFQTTFLPNLGYNALLVYAVILMLFLMAFFCSIFDFLALTQEDRVCHDRFLNKLYYGGTILSLLCLRGCCDTACLLGVLQRIEIGSWPAVICISCLKWTSLINHSLAVLVKMGINCKGLLILI